jgi:hypothetical protein
MDFLFRSNVPTYQGKDKGKASPSTQSARGLLAGLWCALFGGGATPAYKTKGQTSGATALDASPCWAGLSQTPQYKTPPEHLSDPEPELSPCDEPVAEECPCDEPEVIPREIHIYPNG